MAPSRRVSALNVAGLSSPREGTVESKSESKITNNPNTYTDTILNAQPATELINANPPENQSQGFKSSHEWRLLSPRSLAALRFTNELDTILFKPPVPDAIAAPKSSLPLKSVPNSPRQAGTNVPISRQSLLRSKSQVVLTDADRVVPKLQVNQLQISQKEAESHSETPSPRLTKPNFSQLVPHSPRRQIGNLPEAQPTRSGAGKDLAEISRFRSESWQVAQNLDFSASSHPNPDNCHAASSAELPARRNDGGKKLQLDKWSGMPARKSSSSESKPQKKAQDRGSGMWKLEGPKTQEGSKLDVLVSTSLEIVKKDGNSGGVASGGSSINAEESKVRRGSVKPKLVKQPERLVAERGKNSPRGEALGGQLKLEVAPTPVPTKPEPEFPVTWTGDPPLLPQPTHGRHATHIPQPLSLSTTRPVPVLNLPADLSKMSPKQSPSGSHSDPPPLPEKHFPMAAPQLSSLTQRLLEREDARALPGFGANHRLVYDRDNQTDPAPFAPWKPPRSESAKNSPLGDPPGEENLKLSPGTCALQTGFERLKIAPDVKSALASLATDAAPLRPASHNALTRVVKESSATSSGQNSPRGVEVLRFESRFESGNLRKATLVDETEYDLMLQPDVGMSGHTQWFYFGVRNTRPKNRYKFNVLNLLKPKSLFQEGMRILVYSERLAATIKQGWFRTGDEIAYYPNKVKKKGTGYYTLTFVLDPPFADDTLYLAYCYPYTYSDLQTYLKGLCTDPARSPFVERELLCRTLSGNRCDVLTITSPHADEKDKPKKRAVVISARVHPGESNASWMMKGALDFLTSARPEAEKLRETTVFKIVPMLNPDGVINGNHRCSLAQVDLNRVYTSPLPERHPEVWHMKEMVRKLQAERDVVAYVDLHGHSAKKNVFMYGCENKHAPSATAAEPSAPPPNYTATSATRLAERVFPFLVSKAAPDAFCFADCNFRVQKSKESTARVVGWRELGLLNSLTLEASFAGPSKGRLAFHHFTMGDLMDMGASLCRALLDYCTVAETPTPERSVAEIVKEVEAVSQPGLGDPGGSDEDSEAGSSASDDVPHDLRQGKGGLAWQLGGRKKQLSAVTVSTTVTAAARPAKKRKKRKKKKGDSLEEMARNMGVTAKVHSEMAASVSAMLAKGNRGSEALKPRRKSWARPWPEVTRLPVEGLGFWEELGIEAGSVRRSSKRLPIEAPALDLGVEGSVVKRAPRRTSKGNFPLPKLLERGPSFKMSTLREPPSDLDLSWLPPL